MPNRKGIKLDLKKKANIPIRFKNSIPDPLEIASKRLCVSESLDNTFQKNKSKSVSFGIPVVFLEGRPLQTPSAMNDYANIQTVYLSKNCFMLEIQL